MRPSLLRRMACVLGTWAALGHASAGMCYIVSDVSALAKNTALAQEGVAGALQRADAYAAQVLQVATTAKQREAGTSLSGLSRTASELAEANRLVGDLHTLYGSVSNVQAALTRRLDDAKAAGLDWNSYVEYESGRIARNNEAAVARAAQEAAIMQQVQQDFATANQTARKISGTSGMNDAMRLMNTQANQMIVQLARLQRIMAPQAVPAGAAAELRAQRAAKQARRLQEQENMEATRKAMRESEDRAKQTLERIPQ